MRSKMISKTRDGLVIGFAKIVATPHAMSHENMQKSLGAANGCGFGQADPALQSTKTASPLTLHTPTWQGLKSALDGVFSLSFNLNLDLAAYL